MRMFVLVVLAVGLLYPIASRPMLRVFAFCGMMIAYVGAGAVWWTEHSCHFNAQADNWNLAVLARAPHDVTCRGLAPATADGLFIAASYVSR